jgi:2-polyprenyl-3-methyl-5-hydroxy-6-metoxy-1,4-benzoquinol methylase
MLSSVKGVFLPQHLLELHRFVLNEVGEVANRKILDVGCGRGIWGFLIKEKSDDSYTIGVDIYRPYVAFSNRHKVYDDIVLADIRYLPFMDNIFDIVLCCEVVEHLQKKDAIHLLDEIEKKGYKIVVSTPNGFKFTGKVAVSVEAHVSGWDATYFRNKGYAVKGVGLRNLENIEKGNLKWFLASLFYLFTPLAYIVPSLSGWLIATKNRK